MRPRICDIQFSHVLSALEPRVSPEDTLYKSQTLTSRTSHVQVSARDSTEFLRRLSQWLSKEGSSLFLIRAGPRAEVRSKQIATDVITFLIGSPYGVIWNLSQVNSLDRPPSLSELIKGLIFQALRSHPELLHNHLNDLNIARFQQDHPEHEWIELLQRLFSRLSKCFIVIETEELFRAHRDDTKWLLRFFGLFHTLINSSAASGGVLKILIVSYNTPLSTFHSLRGDDNWITMSLQPPIPVPPRLRRPVSRRGRRSDKWQHLRARIWNGAG